MGYKRCKTPRNYEDVAHCVCISAPHLLPPPAGNPNQPLPTPAVMQVPLIVQPAPTDTTLQDALQELRQGKRFPQKRKNLHYLCLMAD